MADGAIELSGAEARRIALRAQRLGRPRPAGGPTPQDLRSLVQGLGAVQLDAVNVLVRSHYLAVYSRLGPYPMALLDDLVYRRREAFEYWGHAASFLPIELYPSLRWRMAAHAENARWRAFLARVERERPGYVAAVEREVAERGPLAFGELRDPARR
ncbi:MAG TPA: crosslink repair DNA glycosylase YcaQ family protein, partial [Pilimelia sp.]|nr:crosslink repair DNA glycosylase YcaQ family protein [Pilimelia sp.]